APAAAPPKQDSRAPDHRGRGFPVWRTRGIRSEPTQYTDPEGMPENERMTPSQNFAWSAEAGLTATEHVCTGKVRLSSVGGMAADDPQQRSEEHTSELQSRENLVCRLLLE